VLNQEDLLANVTGVDGETVNALNVRGENVTVVDNHDGTFSVTPDASFSGDIALTFDVSDGNATVVPSSATVFVLSTMSVGASLVPFTVIVAVDVDSNPSSSTTTYCTVTLVL
jgi:hypothetical protein